MYKRIYTCEMDSHIHTHIHRDKQTGRHACTHTCTHAHARTRTHTHAHTHTCTHTHAHTHTHTCHVHTRTHIHARDKIIGCSTNLQNQRHYPFKYISRVHNYIQHPTHLSDTLQLYLLQLGMRKQHIIHIPVNITSLVYFSVHNIDSFASCVTFPTHWYTKL